MIVTCLTKNQQITLSRNHTRMVDLALFLIDDGSEEEESFQFDPSFLLQIKYVPAFLLQKINDKFLMREPEKLYQLQVNCLDTVDRPIHCLPLFSRVFIFKHDRLRHDLAQLFCLMDMGTSFRVFQVMCTKERVMACE